MSDREFLVNKLIKKQEELEDHLSDDDEYLSEEEYYQYLGAYITICDILSEYWNFIKEELNHDI